MTTLILAALIMLAQPHGGSISTQELHILPLLADAPATALEFDCRYTALAEEPAWRAGTLFLHYWVQADSIAMVSEWEEPAWWSAGVFPSGYAPGFSARLSDSDFFVTQGTTRSPHQASAPFLARNFQNYQFGNYPISDLGFAISFSQPFRIPARDFLTAAKLFITPTAPCSPTFPTGGDPVAGGTLQGQFCLEDGYLKSFSFLRANGNPLQRVDYTYGTDGGKVRLVQEDVFLFPRPVVPGTSTCAMPYLGAGRHAQVKFERIELPGGTANLPTALEARNSESGRLIRTMNMASYEERAPLTSPQLSGNRHVDYAALNVDEQEWFKINQQYFCADPTTLPNDVRMRAEQCATAFRQHLLREKRAPRRLRTYNQSVACNLLLGDSQQATTLIVEYLDEISKLRQRGLLLTWGAEAIRLLLAWKYDAIVKDFLPRWREAVLQERDFELLHRFIVESRPWIATQLLPLAELDTAFSDDPKLQFYLVSQQAINFGKLASFLNGLPSDEVSLGYLPSALGLAPAGTPAEARDAACSRAETLFTALEEPSAPVHRQLLRMRKILGKTPPGANQITPE